MPVIVKCNSKKCQVLNCDHKKPHNKCKECVTLNSWCNTECKVIKSKKHKIKEPK